MSKIVAIHGIGQQFTGGCALKTSWFDAVRDGLRESGDVALDAAEFEVVGYGPVFRQAGTRGAGTVDEKELHAMELALIHAFWHEAAALSRRAIGREGDESRAIQGPMAVSRGRTPQLLQHALRQLAASRFFNALNGSSAVLQLVRQAWLFLHDPGKKQEILARVEAAVTADTRIVVAHSLGSLVAYEALHRNPHWQVKGLITIGSPLGISPMIFDALTPAPVAGTGAWPQGIARWVNIADEGDIVALEKKLAPRFGPVEDLIVHNGWKSHDAVRYLNAAATGHALANMLTDFP